MKRSMKQAFCCVKIAHFKNIPTRSIGVTELNGECSGSCCKCDTRPKREDASATWNCNSESDPAAQTVSFPCQRDDISTFHYISSFLIAGKIHGDGPCSEIILHRAANVTASGQQGAGAAEWQTLVENNYTFCYLPAFGSLVRFVHLGPDFSQTERFLLNPEGGPDAFLLCWVAGFSLDPFGSISWKASSEESGDYWNNSLLYDILLYLNICIMSEKGWKMGDVCLCSPARGPAKFWCQKSPSWLQAFWWWPTAERDPTSFLVPSPPTLLLGPTNPRFKVPPSALIRMMQTHESYNHTEKQSQAEQTHPCSVSRAVGFCHGVCEPHSGFDRLCWVPY